MCPPNSRGQKTDRTQTIGRLKNPTTRNEEKKTHEQKNQPQRASEVVTAGIVKVKVRIPETTTKKECSLTLQRRKKE